MNPAKIRDKSKKISWLLRHGATEAGLSMDTAGWVPIEQVLQHLRICRADLDVIVRDNNKARFEIDEAQIRACQGHSLRTTPVTLEGLEATWCRYEGTARIWHGTGLAALEGIHAQGILPSARTHVHLAASTSSTVGKRFKVQVLLAVSVQRMHDAGLGLWSAPNGVVLARRVPVEAIEGALAQSRKAEAEARRAAGPFPWLEEGGQA